MLRVQVFCVVVFFEVGKGICFVYYIDIVNVVFGWVQEWFFVVCVE